MSRSEKEQEIMGWMCNEDYIKHITTVGDNVIEAGEGERVQLLLKKIGELVDVITDKDTGTVHIDVLRVALFEGLLATYIAHQDFEESGR